MEICFIEKCLPESCKYIPCDVVKRDDRTIVLDINHSNLPDLEKVDIVTLLDVIEYTADVPKLLNEMKKYHCRIILSYNVKDLWGPMFSYPDPRWFNYFDKEDLYNMIDSTGYTIIKEEQIDNTQILLKLKQKETF